MRINHSQVVAISSLVTAGYDPPGQGPGRAAVQEKIPAGNSRRRKDANRTAVETPAHEAGARSYIPGAGYIQVDAVDEVELRDLTEEDARRDGFENVELLRREIVQLYSEQLTDGYRTYRVMFHTVEKEMLSDNC